MSFKNSLIFLIIKLIVCDGTIHCKRTYSKSMIPTLCPRYDLYHCKVITESNKPGLGCIKSIKMAYACENFDECTLEDRTNTSPAIVNIKISNSDYTFPTALVIVLVFLLIILVAIIIAVIYWCRRRRSLIRRQRIINISHDCYSPTLPNISQSIEMDAMAATRYQNANLISSSPDPEVSHLYDSYSREDISNLQSIYS